jgi:triphosphoribosyl-dephospho-CoA synthetase
MRIASPTSKRQRARDPARRNSRKAAGAKRRWSQASCEYAWLAPPKVRGRIREARRWHDELQVATTNGVPRHRWPGQYLFGLDEAVEVRSRAYAELEARDPELAQAVDYVIFWEATREETLEAFKRNARKRVERWARIRYEIRGPREFK